MSRTEEQNAQLRPELASPALRLRALAYDIPATAGIIALPYTFWAVWLDFFHPMAIGAYSFWLDWFVMMLLGNRSVGMHAAGLAIETPTVRRLVFRSLLKWLFLIGPSSHWSLAVPWLFYFGTDNWQGPHEILTGTRIVYQPAEHTFRQRVRKNIFSFAALRRFIVDGLIEVAFMIFVLIVISVAFGRLAGV